MPKKILLADDSITIQKVVELTFSDGDYEVIAVNNGAKAIQKLSEMRPDIILSDIIMPEKNGYEVCEYVKSHPEYRDIPVILLTGTFEPFDPDRADKAGCDAVVTKPFESQSLIHRVEELIQQSQPAGGSAPAPAAAAPEPLWAAAPPPPPAPPAPEPAWPTIPAAPAFEPKAESPFGTSAGFTPAPAVTDPFGGFQANTNDIFGAVPSAPSSTDMPFETPAESFADETRAFPRMSFNDFEKSSQPSAPHVQPPPPVAPPATPAPFDTTPAAAPSFNPPPAAAFPPPAAASPSPFTPVSNPWDEAPSSVGEETRLFPAGQGSPFGKSFEAPAEPAESPAAAAESPFASEPAPFANETRAFPSMSFEELSKLAEAPPSTSPAEASPLDQPESFGDETRAFPGMSFADLQRMSEARGATPAAQEPPPLPPPVEPPASFEAASSFESESSFEPQEPAPAESLWDEAPAQAEPSAFPSAFSDLDATIPPTQSNASAESAPSPWDEPPTDLSTRAFQKIDFADLQSPSAPPAPPAAAEPRADSSLWAEPEPPATPSWSPAEEPSAFSTETFATEAAPPFMAPQEDEPVEAAAETADQAQPMTAATEPEPLWSPAASAPSMHEPESPVESGAPAAAAAAPAGPITLSDEQLDAIARRVVEMLSAEMVKNIAWEVIPDMAEMVVKERIRELESEPQ